MINGLILWRVMGASVCADRTYQNSGNLALLGVIPRFPGRVLDCGCGAGDNARLLAGQGFSVTGITISPSEREIALAHCTDVYLGDLDQGIPTAVRGPYDVIVCSHVLEHLRYPE